MLWVHLKNIGYWLLNDVCYISNFTYRPIISKHKLMLRLKPKYAIMEGICIAPTSNTR